MTVTVEVKVLEDMQKKIELLSTELKELRKNQSEGFERLDTDLY